MPILHTQFRGEVKTADGGVVELPPALALAQGGPVVQVVVMAAEPLLSQLLQQGITPLSLLPAWRSSTPGRRLHVSMTMRPLA